MPNKLWSFIGAKKGGLISFPLIFEYIISKLLRTKLGKKSKKNFSYKLKRNFNL